MRRRPLGLCCVALYSAQCASAGSVSAPEKITLEYREDSPLCLVRRPGFVEQAVAAIPCEDVYQYDVSAATWLQYPDGRIRGTNGLCLHFDEGRGLIAQKCWHTSAEKWTLDDAKRLSCPPLEDFRAAMTSHAAAAAVIPDAAVAPNAAASEPVWAERSAAVWLNEPATLRPFGMSRLADLYRSKLGRQLDERREEFRQLPDPDSDLSALAVTEASLQAESEEVAAVLAEIDNLAAEFRADLDGVPTRVGQGMIVKLSAVGSDDDVAFLTPTFAVTAEQIRRNSQSMNPALVTVSGYIICPKTGQYTFHAADLTSSFRLYVNGEQVIDQWNAPAFGVVQTDKPLQFNEGDEILVTATSSGLMATPAFTVLWSDGSRSGAAPDPIPTDILYPNYARPICAGTSANINRADCQTTFSQLAELDSDAQGRLTVDCPAGCLSSDFMLPDRSYGIFGTPQCYSPDSRVCAAAIHSGVLGERGGSAAIHVDVTREKASYEGVQGFLIVSNEAPAATGCAVVEMPLLESSVEGLKDLQVLETSQVLAANGALSNVAPFTSALPLSASGPVLAARRARGLGWLTAVDQFVCDGASSGSPTKLGTVTPIRLGASQLVPVYATSKTDPIIDLIFSVNETDQSSLISRPAIDHLNRLSCRAKDGSRVSVYFRHADPNLELDYPSRTLSCEHTFDDELAANPLSSFTVRCHRHCAAAAHPVYGSFVYGGRSSVCRAAYHAGVIAEAGGVVRIDRLPAERLITWSSERNGITSSKYDAEPTQLYSVDRPYGRRCIYPQHPPQIITHTRVNRLAADHTAGAANVADIDVADAPDTFLQVGGHFIRPHTDWEPKFVELSTTFDLSEFSHGRAEGLDALEKDLQTSAKAVEDQESALAKARETARSLDTAAVERLCELESQISLLEAEVAESVAESSSEPYTKLCGIRSLYEDWMTLDTVDSTDGPSAWSFHGENCSLSQSSGVSSSRSSVGSVALLRTHNYDAGFIVGRVYVPEGVSGRFGFIAKMQSEVDFVAAVVDIPSEGDPSLSITRCAPLPASSASPPVGGSPLVCQRGLNSVVSADAAVAPGWLDVAVDFSRDSVRIFLNRGAVKTGAEFKDPRLGPGGSVGIFTDGLRGAQGAPLLHFFKIKAGPIGAVASLAKELFPADAEEDLVVHTARPARNVEIDASVASTASQSDTIPASSVTSGTSLATESCVNNVTDSFAKVDSSSALWLLESGNWSGASLGGVAALSATGGAAIRTLVPPICPAAGGVSASVDVAVAAGSEAGLLIRSANPASSLAVTLDFPSADGSSSDSNPTVRLVARKGSTETVYTSSAVEQLLPEAWHSLEARDFFSSVQVLLDGHVVLQQLVPADNSMVPHRGITVPRGTAYFRDFRLQLI